MIQHYQYKGAHYRCLLLVMFVTLHLNIHVQINIGYFIAISVLPTRFYVILIEFVIFGKTRCANVKLICFKNYPMHSLLLICILFFTISMRFLNCIIDD